MTVAGRPTAPNSHLAGIQSFGYKDSSHGFKNSHNSAYKGLPFDEASEASKDSTFEYEGMDGEQYFMNGQLIYEMQFSLKMGEHKVTDKDVVS